MVVFEERAAVTAALDAAAEGQIVEFVPAEEEGAIGLKGAAWGPRRGWVS
jgi:hypothetical protein